MTFKVNPDYKIIGRVLGESFENEVYSEDACSESDIIHHQTYMYAEGNYQCDCNKRIFSELFSDDELDKLGCGDTINYDELWLLHKDGTIIDLLKEGWFKNEPS